MVGAIRCFGLIYHVRFLVMLVRYLAIVEEKSLFTNVWMSCHVMPCPEWKMILKMPFNFGFC